MPKYTVVAVLVDTEEAGEITDVHVRTVKAKAPRDAWFLVLGDLLDVEVNWQQKDLEAPPTDIIDAIEHPVMDWRCVVVMAGVRKPEGNHFDMWAKDEDRFRKAYIDKLREQLFLPIPRRLGGRKTAAPKRGPGRPRKEASA